MPAVAAMHEEVHGQAAEQQGTERQVALGDVGPVVEDQQERSDGKHREEAHAPARSEEGAQLGIPVCHSFSPWGGRFIARTPGRTDGLCR